MTTLQNYCYRTGLLAGELLLIISMLAFAYALVFQNGPQMLIASGAILINRVALRILLSALRDDQTKDLQARLDNTDQDPD